ncbi:aromatic acid exporter family protein [Marmoricola sp. Leaf446]|uniref:FUSC family protein n=1 Tax=Marmoricola sp. Leaf446 TaxID=1736379 RepID=UPI00138F1CE0|nr:aromatic acid exporter family protein [Marmoricola sp. Leaf446]
MVTFREGRRPRDRARRFVERVDPVRVVDLVQTVKTALAGGLAWWMAGVFDLDQAFLAPWAAVLVVHETVYKTVSRGSQQVAATFFAVFLAFGLGITIGTGPWSIGLVILVGYLIGQLRWVKEEAGTIATTGLVVIATGSIAQTDLLASRLIDTALGVAVGLAVNLVVWPPLRDRAAWSQAEHLPGELGAVLRDVAGGIGADLDPHDVKAWIRAIRKVDVHIDQAWRLLWQAKESGRMNPRRSQPTGVRELRKVLHQLEQAVADSLSMARTVARSAENRTDWDESFRERWREVARGTADAVDAEDVPRLEELGEELARMTEDFSQSSLEPEVWREYGGLLMNLRNVHDALTAAVQWNHEATPDKRRSKRFDDPREMLRRERQAGESRRRLSAARGGYSAEGERTPEHTQERTQG